MEKIYAVFSEPEGSAHQDADSLLAGLLHHGYYTREAAISEARELREHGVRAFAAELGNWIQEFG